MDERTASEEGLRGDRAAPFPYPYSARIAVFVRQRTTEGDGALPATADDTVNGQKTWTDD